MTASLDTCSGNTRHWCTNTMKAEPPWPHHHVEELIKFTNICIDQNRVVFQSVTIRVKNVHS